MKAGSFGLNNRLSALEMADFHHPFSLPNYFLDCPSPLPHRWVFWNTEASVAPGFSFSLRSWGESLIFSTARLRGRGAGQPAGRGCPGGSGPCRGASCLADRRCLETVGEQTCWGHREAPQEPSARGRSLSVAPRPARVAPAPRARRPRTPRPSPPLPSAEPARPGPSGKG